MILHRHLLKGRRCHKDHIWIVALFYRNNSWKDRILRTPCCGGPMFHFCHFVENIGNIKTQGVKDRYIVK